MGPTRQLIKPPAAHQCRPACLKTSSMSSRSSNQTASSTSNLISRGSTSDHPQQIKPHPPRQKSNLTTRSTLKRSAHLTTAAADQTASSGSGSGSTSNLINRGSMSKRPACQAAAAIKPPAAHQTSSAAAAHQTTRSMSRRSAHHTASAAHQIVEAAAAAVIKLPAANQSIRASYHIHHLNDQHANNSIGRIHCFTESIPHT